MIQIKCILCPMDFSSISKTALRYALALARNHGASLHVFHAVSPVSLSSKKSDARIRSVLIATDFGPGTAEAVEWGVGIAGEAAARVTLMHVIPQMATANLEETYLTALTRGIEVQLRALVAPIDAKGVEIGVRVETGLPWRLISNVAHVMKPDLIVMNIHGKSRLDRTLLGSTAERTVRSAECPVLSIPPRSETSGKLNPRRAPR